MKKLFKKIYFHDSFRHNSKIAKEEFLILKYLDGVISPTAYSISSYSTKSIIEMEFIEGIHPHLLKSQDLNPSHFIKIASEAINKIHKMGVIHGDLSPDNILIKKSGKIVIIDFETSARIALRNKSNPPPMNGKLKYSSPQRILSQSPSRDDDIYALKIIGWEIQHQRSWIAPETLLKVKKGIIPLKNFLSELESKIKSEMIQ